MTREEAIEILNEVKAIDDSMFSYNESYMMAVDMAINALKAQETPIEKVASDYGLTVDGVEFALQQYQTVICEITHSRMSKLSYYADDILRLVNDIQCEYCEKDGLPRLLTTEDFKDNPAVDSKGRLPAWVEHNWKLGPSLVDDGYSAITKEEMENWDKSFVRWWTSRPTKAQTELEPWE